MSTDLKRFSKSNNADKEFNKFVSWLREGGAEFPDVGLHIRVYAPVASEHPVSQCLEAAIAEGSSTQQL